MLRQGFDKSTQKRLFVFVTNVLTNHGKVPLRHLVNEETLFISLWGPNIKKVNEWVLITFVFNTTKEIA